MFPLSMMFQYKIIHNIRWVKSLYLKWRKKTPHAALFVQQTLHRKNFGFPNWEIPVNFPNLGIILGKNWEWNYQNNYWENFGKLNHFQDHRKGIFWDIIIIFSKLHFGNIMGITQFWGKIGAWISFFAKILDKKLGKFCLGENRNYYFGKILGNLKSSLHFSQFFLDLGNVFPKMWKHWEQSC